MTSRGIGDRPRLTNLQRRRSSAIRPRTRRIVLEAGPLEVPVHLVEALAPGEVVRGPAIIELPGSTLLLRPAFWAGADRAGNLLAFRSERREIADLLTR
jgi:N-methylhydantoinase A